MTRRRSVPPRRNPWTVKRATGAGVVAGFAAILMRIVYPGWPEALRWPFLALCSIAAFCGASILWITAVDRYRYGKRGDRLIPLRVFDVALALLLIVPSLLAIRAVLGLG